MLNRASTLSFNQEGKLVSAKTVKNIQAGIRPICQAKKLLDKDPVVKKMAEQDILIMGRMCKPYLQEQREKAAPPLQKAIDVIWNKIELREPVD